MHVILTDWEIKSLLIHEGPSASALSLGCRRLGEGQRYPREYPGVPGRIRGVPGRVRRIPKRVGGVPGRV